VSAAVASPVVVVSSADPARRLGPALDPRLYQIATLASLLLYGLAALRFDVRVGHALAIVAGALATQYAAGRAFGARFDPKSALISALSLCLLLRTNHLGLALAAAVLAVGSKFAIRVRGKHVFNPTNGALVALMAATGQVWVSPGQWGNVAFFAFLMACLGGLVVNRAARSDVTFAFLFVYLSLVFARSWWLGEPMAIPIHRLQNGALLLFAFFMISDPKTTPDRRGGRVLFAALVAFGGWYVQFRLFRTNGLLWSLALFSLVVPLIDRVWPGPRHAWAPARS
jgi:Na+-transporting NADH:ubiquinone oxidoreductase subunit NqrB